MMFSYGLESGLGSVGFLLLKIGAELGGVNH